MRPDQIKSALEEHARKSMRQRHEIQSIKLDDQPLEFWCLPLSAADIAKYSAKLAAGEADVFVDLLVDKAETEDGERLFKPGASVWLKPLIDSVRLAELADVFKEAATPVDKQINDAVGN